MEIQVSDDKRQCILNFKIGSNNRISRRYLSTMLPGILGLYYKKANGHFSVFEWMKMIILLPTGIPKPFTNHPFQILDIQVGPQLLGQQNF